MGQFESICPAVVEATNDLRMISARLYVIPLLRGMLESREVKKTATALRVLRHFEPEDVLGLVLPIYRLAEVSVHYFDAVRLLTIVLAKRLKRALIPLVFERMMGLDNHYDYYPWRLTVLILGCFGFADEAERVALLALAHDDPEAREVEREIVAELGSGV